jgi:hypothetical protein
VQSAPPPGATASAPVTELDALPDVVCTLHGLAWDARAAALSDATDPGGAPLRLHAGGAPFATVRRLADATLALPAAGAFGMLSGTSAGVEIRGLVDAADVPVFAASAVLFDGQVIPGPRTNVVRRLYHFGRSVSDLAQACRLMGEGAYDRLHAARSLIGKEVGDEVKMRMPGGERTYEILEVSFKP